MKKVPFLFITILIWLGLCAGCTQQPQASKRDGIPFQEGQYYAVAHLGYQQIEDLDVYVDRYLDSDQLPIHYLSGGDYYLVIPRYAGMKLYLYYNDMETMESILIYEEPNCRPFILQCNVSDIFADATIRLQHGSDTAEFSPFISLKDGSLDVGTQGLLLSGSADSQSEAGE